MNIAFIHNALGKTDGVSLEIDKWRKVLEEMGHTVFYCAGNNDVAGVYSVPELSFNEELTNKILKNTTVELQDYRNVQELEKDIYYQATVIKEKILKFIDKYEISVLIPNNLLSVGYNIPAVIALSEIIKETGIPTISHNHDFYFEDSGEVEPTCQLVWDILDKYAPADFENVQNIVINRLAQQELKNRKGIEAMVVPNVFDFSRQSWVEDEYNRDFRESVGIGENDIVFLQATRILDRKGVEMAIDIVAEIDKEGNRKRLYGQLYNGKIFSPDDNIVLLCSGYVEKYGISGEYQSNLLKKAKDKGVDLRFVGDRVKHSRGVENGAKIYSLWDSYVHADFVTYPSIWEGWGNQLIEALFAKLPVIIFEYPVFKSDLKQDGLRLVSLGDEIKGLDNYGLVKIGQKKVRKAVKEVILYLKNEGKRVKMVEYNYNIARDNYSFAHLKEIIEKLLAKIKEEEIMMDL